MYCTSDRCQTLTFDNGLLAELDHAVAEIDVAQQLSRVSQ